MCDYQCTRLQASVLSNCESNRIEKSIRQRESNRIELFFPESECSSRHCRRSQPVISAADASADFYLLIYLL